MIKWTSENMPVQMMGTPVGISTNICQELGCDLLGTKISYFSVCVQVDAGQDSCTKASEPNF